MKNLIFLGFSLFLTIIACTHQGKPITEIAQKDTQSIDSSFIANTPPPLDVQLQYVAETQGGVFDTSHTSLQASAITGQEVANKLDEEAYKCSLLLQKLVKKQKTIERLLDTADSTEQALLLRQNSQFRYAKQ